MLVRCTYLLRVLSLSWLKSKNLLFYEIVLEDFVEEMLLSYILLILSDLIPVSCLLFCHRDFHQFLLEGNHLCLILGSPEKWREKMLVYSFYIENRQKCSSTNLNMVLQYTNNIRLLLKSELRQKNSVYKKPQGLLV